MSKPVGVKPRAKNAPRSSVFKPASVRHGGGGVDGDNDNDDNDMNFLKKGLNVTVKDLSCKY